MAVDNDVIVRCDRFDFRHDIFAIIIAFVQTECGPNPTEIISNSKMMCLVCMYIYEKLGLNWFNS